MTGTYRDESIFASINSRASPETHRKTKPRRKSKSKPVPQAEAERRQRQREQDWRDSALPPPIGHNAPPVEHRDRVLTFGQWCAVNGFSEATGHRIIKGGNGPAVLQLSTRRIGIKESANAAWQASRTR
jgi:predicted DNA-binding transcriptional regulator AlpA